MELTLDDQLKQAQIDKTTAEARKLQREADSLRNQAWSSFWSEAVKVIGGVVLGIGGVVVAYTQYEVSELKAKIAKDDLARAQSAKSDAEKAQAAAEAAANSALAKRDAAVKEQKDAEAAIAELKNTLTQTTNALKTVKPTEVRNARLAYIQFRGDLSRNLINELRLALSSKAFNAPGAERVAGDYQNLIKYFNPTEGGDADELAAAVESFFSSKGCPLKMRVVPATSTTIKDSPPEIWLSHKCTK